MKSRIYSIVLASSLVFTGCKTAQNTQTSNVNPGEIDINEMPKPGPTPTINIAQPKMFTMSNGLKVMVVENHKLPRVNVTVSMDRPPYYEGNIVGVSQIMADQLGNGTTKMSKDAFNKRVDYLGANLNFSSNGAFGNTLSKYFPEVLGLMADAMINPKFDAEEVQKTKDRMIEGLKADKKSADAIASRVSTALTYGKNTARGEFETEETIKNVKLQDVINNYNKYYAPDNAYLVVVGDVKFDEAKKLIEKNFGSWKKSNTKFDALQPANNVATTEVNIVDVPNAVQSVIEVGNLHNLKMNDPQYFSAKLANFILGGGGEARLFMNLREKNGYTYGAYSSLSTGKYSQSFSASSSVRNEVTDKAVVEFMNELNGIKTVKADELANAKAKFKGDFIRSLEQPSTIASFALNKEVHDLPDDFYTNYLKSIDAVTVADINKAVNSTILPNKSRIFVAGKASEISEGLEKLGYPVKYYDDQANPVAKPVAQKVDATVTTSSIADKYITAIGGKAAVSKINSITTNSVAKVQGMDMNIKTIQAKGAKSLTDVKMMGNSIQKIVFDGKDGYMEGQGQKMPMPDEMKASMAKQTEVFPELNFSKDASLKVAGIEKYNGEDSYVVKGDNVTYYYSVKTGLKTGEVRSEGGMTVPTSFSDYKDVAGVKMPYKISQNMSGMDIEMNVQSIDINQAKDADFK